MYLLFDTLKENKKTRFASNKLWNTAKIAITEAIIQLVWECRFIYLFIVIFRHYSTLTYIFYLLVIYISPQNTNVSLYNPKSTLYTISIPSPCDFLIIFEYLFANSSLLMSNLGGIVDAMWLLRLLMLSKALSDQNNIYLLLEWHQWRGSAVLAVLATTLLPPNLMQRLWALGRRQDYGIVSE